ncbi:MAG: methylmalonyl-CoA mutase family protein, partial [Actinomycetota bacterium]
WSLRAQQILAYESDLLEHGDLFEGSKVMEELTERIETEAWEELGRVQDQGGSVEALGYMKERLVAEHAERLRAVESGERAVVGVNRYVETEPSPLVEGLDDGFAYHQIDPEAEAEQVESLERWRGARDEAAVRSALDALRRSATADDDLVPPSIEAAHAGATTGEWAAALRDVFGDYRAPTGVSGRAQEGAAPQALEQVRTKVGEAAKRAGARRLRMLVAKPGLDGHSNAAEQVAVRARDAGFEVIYQGIRLTPEQIARAAAEEDVHVIGVSILSGAHNLLVPEVLDRLRAEGVDPDLVPVVVGGIIPDEDAEKLLGLGAARIYTPRDHDLTGMMGEIADLVAANGGAG